MKMAKKERQRSDEKARRQKKMLLYYTHTHTRQRSADRQAAVMNECMFLSWILFTQQLSHTHNPPSSHTYTFFCNVYSYFDTINYCFFHWTPSSQTSVGSFIIMLIIGVTMSTSNFCEWWMDNKRQKFDIWTQFSAFLCCLMCIPCVCVSNLYPHWPQRRLRCVCVHVWTSYLNAFVFVCSQHGSGPSCVRGSFSFFGP